MKATERKIKQSVPFEALGDYLRHLADAVENKTERLPSELIDLPEPIGKMEMKGKARDGHWELKIKIKARPAADPDRPMSAGRRATVESAGPLRYPKIDYKTLKKRMQESFKDIGKRLAAQQLPEVQVLREFLADSERMVTFSGEKYGGSYYPAYREACRRLSEAHASGNLNDFKAAYAALDQMKKDCHKAYK